MKILEPEAPIKVKSSTSLRFELLPKFGPLPWLDKENSIFSVEEKFKSNLISGEKRITQKNG